MKKLFLIIAVLCSNAFANITDIKIGVAQIFGAQWQTNTLGEYKISRRFDPAFSDGATGKQYGKTELDAMKAAGQYFMLKQPTAGVNDFALRIVDSSGNTVKYVSYSGKIAGMANGLIHYVSNNQYDLFIFPNNGYSTGLTDSSSNTYGGKSTPPTTAQMANYIPPSNTPIQTAGSYVAPGGGSFGGGAAPVYVSNMTTVQSNQLTSAVTQLGSATNGNKVYLEEKTGTSGSVVNIEQVGRSNTVQGIGGGNATIEGTGDIINIKQGSISGKNIAEFSVKGNTNKLTMMQGRSSTGAEITTDISSHYAAAAISGNGNEITIVQSNKNTVSGSSSGHFESLSVTGNYNKVAITQTDDMQKRFWGNINGNSNTLNVTQQDNSIKYLDVTLVGFGNTANIIQKGTGVHRATISLTNAGGASTLNLTQQGGNVYDTLTGTMVPQVYSISQTCTVPSGCSASVIQGQ